jgi:hypothetical protein
MESNSARVNRRMFLLAASSIGVAAAVAKYFPSQTSASKSVNPARLRGGGFLQGSLFSPKVRYHLSTEFTDGLIFDLDFANLKLRYSSTDIAVHVIETHPFDRELTVLATKRADKMALFDWRTHRQIADHRLENREFFYGHSVFTDDGRLLLATTFDEKVSRGAISIFDVPTLKRVAMVNVGAGSAHEICPLGGNRFIFGHRHGDVMAFGKFDLATHSIENFPTEFHTKNGAFSMTHLKDCGDTFVANMNTYDPVSDQIGAGALVSIHKQTLQVKTEIPLGASGLGAEMLSLDYDPSTDYVWITIPTIGKIKIWNLGTDSLVTTLDFGNELPTGLSNVPNKGLTIVTTAQRFFVFDSKTLKRQESIESRWPHEVLSGRLCAHTRIV